LVDLESFFKSWEIRTPKKLLSLIIIKDGENNCKSIDDHEENMKIITIYKNLGIIKFGTIGYEEEGKVEEKDYYFYY
jgi:hypothetical protein